MKHADRCLHRLPSPGKLHVAGGSMLWEGFGFKGSSDLLHPPNLTTTHYLVSSHVPRDCCRFHGRRSHWQSVNHRLLTIVQNFTQMYISAQACLKTFRERSSEEEIYRPVFDSPQSFHFLDFLLVKDVQRPQSNRSKSSTCELAANFASDLLLYASESKGH